MATYDPTSLDRALGVIGRMQRRDFLAFTGAAAATLGAGAAAAGSTIAVPQLKSINEAETRIFLRVAEVVLPVEGTPLTPWKPAELLGTLDGALLGTMEPHILAGLKGGLAYFNDGPKAQHGKTFIELDDATAAAFLDAWGNSDQPPHRGLSMGLKKLVQLSYWANPASWAPTGYDGPISKKNGLVSLGNAPLPTR
ncbi:hypothetical protein [Hydrogenophaga sp. 5NK40-0174]|uniref:hypothetical protein n=1 Tax=Hydrogenophaga sp. 5NK40-0174 TaxID=3127649 RepID=UPI00310706EC